MKKTILLPFTFYLFFSLLISGCGNTAKETAAPTLTTIAPTEIATPTPTPEPEPIPCTIAFDTDRDGNREVYSMNPEGEDLINLTNDPGDDYEPSWSPDGDQIAFVSNRDNGKGGGQFIYVMNSDGTNVRQLTTENFSASPDWSHDYQRILYSSGGDIYVINSDGSGQATNLTNSPETDRSPVWSMDDSQIAWLSGEENDWDLKVMNADGSNIQQLTDDGKVTDVDWTVDGRLFAHWDNPAAGCMNCLMNSDGSDVQNAGGKGEIQQYLPFWTSNGDRVELVSGNILTSDNEIYLVSEIYPDLFLNLTNNPADDVDPDWPSNCGPNAKGTEANSTEANTTGERYRKPKSPLQRILSSVTKTLIIR